MLHRHLNHGKFTLAAIDDVIARGSMNDWLDLRSALVNDTAVAARVHRIASRYANDPLAQRQQFWLRYAQSRARSS